MSDKNEWINWIWSLFPIQPDRTIPHFEVKIKRLAVKHWTADVVCIGENSFHPFNLRLFGRAKDMEFNSETWIENRKSEATLVLAVDSAEKSPEPSGREIEDVFWIAIASTRRPAVGIFGTFKGRVFFSRRFPDVLWLSRRIFMEFLRTGLTLIAWSMIAIIVVWLIWSTSQSLGR